MNDLIVKKILLTKSIKDGNLGILKKILFILPAYNKTLLITRYKITLEEIQSFVENFLVQAASIFISADENVANEELNCASLLFPNIPFFLSFDNYSNYYKKAISIAKCQTSQEWAISLSDDMELMFSIMLDCMSSDIVYKNFKDFLVTYRDVIYQIGENIITCDNDIDKNEIDILTTLILTFDTMLFNKNVIHTMPNQAQTLFEQNITTDTNCESRIHNQTYISNTITNENKDKQLINLENNNQAKLKEYLDELNKLIGLNSVKQEVMSLVNLIKVRNIRQQNALSIVPMSLHLVSEKEKLKARFLCI